MMMKKDAEEPEGALSLIMDALDSNRFIHAIGDFKVAVVPEQKRFIVRIAHPYLSQERLEEYSAELQKELEDLLAEHDITESSIWVDPYQLPID